LVTVSLILLLAFTFRAAFIHCHSKIPPNAHAPDAPAQPAPA